MIEAKKYLEQVRRADSRINNRLRQLDDLKLKATALGGFDYDRERVKTSGSKDTMSDAVVAYADMETAINREIDSYIDLRDSITMQINALYDPNHIQILGKRYLEGKKLEQIAKEMNYEYGTIRNLHGVALLRFQMKYASEIREYLRSHDIK